MLTIQEYPDPDKFNRKVQYHIIMTTPTFKVCAFYYNENYMWYQVTKIVKEIWNSDPIKENTHCKVKSLGDAVSQCIEICNLFNPNKEESK